MITDMIREELFALRDEKYRDFQVKLIPTVAPDSVIGVRTPELRRLAKQLVKREDLYEFLHELPHKYFDENQLHAFAVSLIKDFDVCVDEVCRFLPYVDNWATCDQMSPKVFAKHREELLSHIDEWIASGRTYSVRFGVGMLMEHSLGDAYDPAYAERVAAIESDEYYVNMMRAWYFATALAKNYGDVIPFIEGRRLDRWTHNKAIQKSVESCRITPEQKEYLKTLKVPSNKTSV